MSDYTTFTKLNYGNSENGQRYVDPDAIGAEFAKCGGSYYGNGSEFIVGYDANGGAMVDTDAVRNAARRKAEEAAESRRAEDALLRMLASNRQANTYLYHGRDMIYYPLGGKVYALQLLHKSGNCPYLFDHRKLGPFNNYMEGLVKISESVAVHGNSPCPYCFRERSLEDAEDTAKMDSIMNVLRNGTWHKEDYTLEHPKLRPAPKPAQSTSKSTSKDSRTDKKTEPAKSSRPVLPNHGPAYGNSLLWNYGIAFTKKGISVFLKVVSPVPITEEEARNAQVHMYLNASFQRHHIWSTSKWFKGLALFEDQVFPVEIKSAKGFYKGEGHGYFFTVHIPKELMSRKPKWGYYEVFFSAWGDFFCNRIDKQELKGNITPSAEINYKW